MTNTSWLIYAILFFGLYTGICAVLIVSYRKSRNQGFLWLLLALVLWPAIDSLSEALRQHYTDMVFAGVRPRLFPFTRMGSVLGGWRPWELPPGEFRIVFDTVKAVIGAALLLLALVMVLKGLPKNAAAGMGLSASLARDEDKPAAEGRGSDGV